MPTFRRYQGSDMPTETKPLTIQVAIGLILVVLLGVALRFAAVNGSVVNAPIRADARDYYFYALNMGECGVYSRQLWDEARCPANLHADVQRWPGYPLFLVPFAKFPPDKTMVQQVQYAQVLLGTLTILLFFALFRPILGAWPSILGACFVAISPHLVASGVYLLSEVLFTFFLMAWLYLSVLLLRSGRAGWALLAGLALAAAALTRPTMIYFLVPFLAFLLFSLPRRSWLGVVLACVGFISLYGPWWAYSHMHLPPGAGSSSLARDTVQKGMYPNLTYKGNPRSYGFPNHFDPKWSERTTLAAVLDEIVSRFSADPVRYLRWYVLGKPYMLFSWDMVVGQGDVWIYPLLINPYELNDPLMDGTHALMKALHWLLVLLAAIACVLVWLPFGSRYLARPHLYAMRLLSLVVLYFLAVHMIGTPLPRYAVPLRPVIYGQAILTVYILWQWLKGRSATQHAIPSDRDGEG
jgi:4-amino-4-deoxy-L-arabinose transferase-like glycosyltransferase